MTRVSALLFLNSNGELRSGWKFVIYTTTFLVLWVASGVAISVAITETPWSESELALLGVNALALFLPAVASLWLAARFLEHLPIAVFGVTFHERWHRDFSFGLLAASMMLLVLLAAVVAVGQVDFSHTAANREFGFSFAFTVAVLLVSAANEELVFRGYPLQVLMSGFGPWPAMVLMSALFSLIHSSNPSFTWLGAMNTFLAGMMLSIAYLRTRSLWLPFGIHFTWNLGLGAILGFPLSGIDISSIWMTDVAGAEWLTGGAYGPEGGLFVTVIFLSLAVVLLITRRIGVSPSLRSLLEENAGKVYIESVH